MILSVLSSDHPAPLQGGVYHSAVRPWRAEQDRLLHIRPESSDGEYVQQTEGLVQGQTDGNEVSVETKRVT